MALRRQGLFNAVRRAKREHRLTDLFWFVLESHLGFANSLLAKAGLQEANSVAGTVELPTPAGRKVDLQLLGFDDLGECVARLWSEHKVGSDYQPDQLPDYADALSLYSDPHQLITIVDHPEDVPEDDDSPDHPRWLGLTWRDVAMLAVRAGEEAARPEERAYWREAAGRPDGPASQMLLMELLDYLEEVHGVVLNPLGHEHVAALAKLPETGKTLIDFLERAARDVELQPDQGVGADASDNWERFSFYQAFNANGTWAEGLEGYPELEAADTDYWSTNRIGEPAFGAGFTLPTEVDDELRSSRCRDWRNAVQFAGFSVHRDELYGWVYVRRTKYLVELIPLGVTLDMQVREVARWVNETLSLLAKHDPGLGPLAKPAARPRKEKNAERDIQSRSMSP